jgi:fatty-acyl-CoA synthase
VDEGVFGRPALTPTAFLARSAVVHADRPAWRAGAQRFTYAELADRSARLAGALAAMGVEPGDRVSVLAPNTNLALEAHFGVPWAGAVLNALNTRLSAGELATIVGHAGSRALLVDHELADVGRAVASAVGDLRVVVDGPSGEYDAALLAAPGLRRSVEDETGLFSLNYTSGTTGRPKGVMYAHRGAHLQALAMAAQAGLGPGTVFLWTLPMFHCNGWCFPWAVTAVGGLHVGLRRVEPAEIWRAIREDGVTHLNAAPTVLTGLAHHPDAFVVPGGLRVATGGAPPAPALLARLEELGITVTHLYGLTETYGPAVICDWRPEWATLAPEERARHQARQGVTNLVGEPVRVVDVSGADVPADGVTTGEVVLRGNTVMLGYYRDPAATAAATLERPDGRWFRTGDIGVLHPDGYLELRDRAKDVIVSGGENITSIEVEQALASHPDVLECAVVAGPDDRWGEVPVAYVTLRPGAVGSPALAEALVAHVKGRIARFKAPQRIEFGDLPKTATGKIQKFLLRERQWEGRDRRIG